MGSKRYHSPFFCVNTLLFSRGVLLSSMVQVITYRPSRRAAQQHSAPHHRNTAKYTVGMATSFRQYIAPANPRRKAATDVLIEKIKHHRVWPVHNDVCPPTSPALFQKTTVVGVVKSSSSTSDINTKWQEVRDSAIVANKVLVSNLTVRQPGFELPRRAHSHCRTASVQTQGCVQPICRSGV